MSKPISVLVRHRIMDPACGLLAMRSDLTAAMLVQSGTQTKMRGEHPSGKCR